MFINATVWIETLQGSKSNAEKRHIKAYFRGLSLIHWTPAISQRAMELIDQYANNRGLWLADAQIAATALEYNLPVLTDNHKDFHFIVGLALITPPVPQTY